ncbi:MAG: cation diffusion facilitator family transporter [Candidatus Cloacimonetes bacterium]|nr:cation diffusion facilitator family transporter [Candidatus Cloacimonadota bacterium]
MSDEKSRDRLTAISVNLGLLCNVILAALKTSVGIFGHSPALLADGINSTSDVAYYIAVKIFMTHAKKPADKEHPWGHRQLEPIAAIVVGAFILTTGVAIFWGSINQVYELFSGSASARIASLWALVIALATFFLKIFLYFFTRKAAKNTHNPTLRALANDHLNDIMAALAVVVGLLMGKLGYPWMDPAAGAIVAIYIAKTGVEIIMDSSSELMDRVPDEAFVRDLQSIAKTVNSVQGVQDVSMHRFGTYYTLHLTLSMVGKLSLEEAHAKSHEVEKLLKQRFGDSLKEVHIHYHPLSQNQEHSASRSHPQGEPRV